MIKTITEKPSGMTINGKDTGPSLQQPGGSLKGNDPCTGS